MELICTACDGGGHVCLYALGWSERRVSLILTRSWRPERLPDLLLENCTNAEPLTSIVTAMLVPSPLHPNERKQPDLDVHAPGREGRLGDGWIEFRPARWLVATVALLWLGLVRPQFGKRALVALAWRFIPRRLKLIAGGVAAVALVMLAGSVAALVFVLDQLA